MDVKIARARMAAAERRLRARAAQILSGGLKSEGILHGSLVERQRVCGKKNCRCTRGEKHRALFLLAPSGKHIQLAPAANLHHRLRNR